MEEKQSNSYDSSKVKNTGEPLEILSSFASDLLIMNNSEDIFEFTAKQLQHIIPDSIIIVNTYNPEDESLSVYTIKGIHPFITKITSLLGYNPVLSKFKARNIQDNLLRQPNNTLYEIKGGLPELTFGKITSAQERRMQKILKINSIYSTGLVFGDQIFGSVAILHKGKKLTNKQLAESIIRLSSNAMYRIKAQQAFLKSQQKLQNIIDKIDEGVLHITQGGNIVYANKNTCDLVAYSLDELKQMTVYDFVHDKESLKTLSNRIWQQSAEVRNDFQVKVSTRTGKSKWLRVKGNKLTDDGGVENGYLAILSDLSEIQKHEAIQKELDIVKGTASVKEQFLSNIGHEMITPLNGISGLVEVLLESDLSDENKEIASIIHDSSRQLHRIIDEILQFTRIEKGFLKFEPRPFDLYSLLDQNYQLFSASAKQKNIELRLDYQGRKDVYLVGDDVKINQVLSNLLGNAIKFTPQNGKIKFTAKLTEQSQDKVYLRFDIDDNGVGVDPRKQQSI
ncbi:MAG: PAS domain-containing sensor histidine kinase, partial [Bacteroidota bacterium]